MTADAIISSDDGVHVRIGYCPTVRHTAQRLAAGCEITLSDAIRLIEQRARLDGATAVTIQAGKWPRGTFKRGHIFVSEWIGGAM